MPVFGITGGIATGKSTFAHALRQSLDAELFDADACARELLRDDPEVRASIAAIFGAAALDERGAPDRLKLRTLVFADDAKRKALESILHPVIRRGWTSRAAAVEKAAWFLVDIPLLFETAAEAHFESVIVVACSPATQRARLRESRQLEDEMAERIIAAQLALPLKIAKADHLIWNDASTASLGAQATLLAGYLRNRYG